MNPTGAGTDLDFGCVACGRFGKALFKCTRCRGPATYCSKACFRKMWKFPGLPNHKEECESILGMKAMLEPQLALHGGLNFPQENEDMFHAAEGIEDPGERVHAFNMARTHGIAAISLYDKWHLSEGRGLAPGGSDKGAQNLGFASTTEQALFHLRGSTATACMQMCRTSELREHMDENYYAREAIALDPHHTGLVALESIMRENREGGIPDHDERQVAVLYKHQVITRFERNNFSPVVGLIMAKFVNSVTAESLANRMLFDWLDDHREEALRQRRQEFGSRGAAVGLCPSPPADRFNDPWGQCMVKASLVPMQPSHAGQWLSLTVASKNESGRPGPKGIAFEMNDARMIVADANGSHTAIDASCVPHQSNARAGTEAAVQVAKDELKRLCLDLEKRGMLASQIVVGAGLFAIWDHRDDLAIFFPEYSQVERAHTQLDRERRIAAGEAVHDAGNPGW